MSDLLHDSRIHAAGWAPPPSMVGLHGMWRSGSTYVWSRFREAHGAYAYYEPLHPGLGRLNRRRIPRDTPELVAANRHPPLSQPYFTEYEPLLGWRGVKGFRRSFAFDRFALDGAERHPALLRYLARLRDHAAAQGRLGVFGFNQTSLRVGWLRRRFDTFDVHVERAPYDIWLSYMEHLQRGNGTYFQTWMLIIERNRDHPLFAPLAERLRLRTTAERMSIKAKAFYGQAARETRPETLYLMVYYLWLACALHALSACDVVIDTGMAGKPGYAASLSARIAAGCGLKIDLSAMRTAPPAMDLVLPGRLSIEREALGLFHDARTGDLVNPERVGRRLAEITPDKADRLAAVVTQTA